MSTADFKAMHATVDEFVDELVKTMAESRRTYGEEGAVTAAIVFLTGTDQPRLVAASLAVAALRLADREAAS